MALTQEHIHKLIALLGGCSNIAQAGNCMTRLRLTLNDHAKVDTDAIKALPWVMGVVISGGQYQVVLGPGRAAEARELVEARMGQCPNKTATQEGAQSEAQATASEVESLDTVAKRNKAEIKSRGGRVQAFFATFATIFTPLIPGFIAAGLMMGVASLIAQIAGPEALKATPFLASLVAFLKIFGKGLFTFLGILIGYNASKAFGGSGVVGAIVASLFVLGYNPEATKGVYSGMSNFFGMPIDPRGNIIGILIAASFSAAVEKRVRRVVPATLDMLLTSTITLLIMAVATYLVIMPVGGVLFKGMSWLFTHLSGNPIGCAILAGLFLPSVMMGIHQGFVPVYFALMEAQGFNSLFPVLALAGAGQVGAALALYLKASKQSMLRQQVKGAILPGFLGIGEPLLYGVTLPRIKPFITACIGGACGGFTVGLVAWLGLPVGLNSVFGPSGLLALPLMTSNSGVFAGMAVYMLGMIAAWVGGFASTWIWGSKGVDLS